MKYKRDSRYISSFALSVIGLEKTVLLISAAGVTAILFASGGQVDPTGKLILTLGIISAMLTIVLVIATIGLCISAHTKISHSIEPSRKHKAFIKILRFVYIFFFMSEAVLLSTYFLLNV